MEQGLGMPGCEVEADTPSGPLPVLSAILGVTKATVCAVGRGMKSTGKEGNLADYTLTHLDLDRCANLPFSVILKFTYSL